MLRTVPIEKAIIPIQRYVVNIDIASLYPDHIPAEPAGSGLNDRCLAIADNGSIRPYRQCPGRVNDIHPVREINRILALGCLLQCSLNDCRIIRLSISPRPCSFYVNHVNLLPLIHVITSTAAGSPKQGYGLFPGRGVYH